MVDKVSWVAQNIAWAHYGKEIAFQPLHVMVGQLRDNLVWSAENVD